MPQSSAHSLQRERALQPSAECVHRCRLVAVGTVTAQQAYAATLVLARLHDRRVALTMTLEEMCEVLGYLGAGRRPKSVPSDRVVPPQLRGGAEASRARRDADG